MATNATRSQQVAGGNPAIHSALAQDAALRRTETLASGSPESGRKPVGYGLPCSKCRLYYPADLDRCPTCHHSERVSPVTPAVRPRIAQAATETIPDSAAVEQEREEFLRQFKSQLLEAHADVVNVPETFCTLVEHHDEEAAPATVCKSCYEHLQEKVEVYEAALHFDMQEAAQIIYDAVWSDPSDPNKTYQNAATALLTELRKRAGLSTVLGPFQPLTH